MCESSEGRDGTQRGHRRIQVGALHSLSGRNRSHSLRPLRNDHWPHNRPTSHPTQVCQVACRAFFCRDCRATAC